ncbi:MAG: hypothetical protein ACI9R8_000133 [Candidatus Paceibacteria bacterium]|jgi:hypothetical protein
MVAHAGWNPIPQIRISVTFESPFLHAGDVAIAIGGLDCIVAFWALEFRVRWLAYELA